jgi:hypothetical protein
LLNCSLLHCFLLNCFTSNTVHACMQNTSTSKRFSSSFGFWC